MPASNIIGLQSLIYIYILISTKIPRFLLCIACNKMEKLTDITEN